MKKLNVVLILVLLLSLTFDSCDKLGLEKYEIIYSCQNFSKGTVSLVYVGADGNNVVDEPLIGSFSFWESDRTSFNKGDFVSIQAQHTGEKRSTFYVTISIRCFGCESLDGGSSTTLSKTLDLSNGNLVDLTGNIY